MPQLAWKNQGHPYATLWTQAKMRQAQPRLDWTKANSFHVMVAVTEGREVMPRITASANAVTPVNILCQWRIRHKKG